MKYIKQLDSLRAIAVLLVIIAHWFPPDNIINKMTYHSLGAIGVNIFFVLSGFLITGILLDYRKQVQKLNLSKKNVVKIFFMRRALRIFPIYYLTITFLLIVHPLTATHIRDNYLYFYTYTANWYFYEIQAWDGMISHLWSLSVEEQFYLIWPWIILYLKEGYLKYIIVLFILVGLISNFIFSGGPTSGVLTTSCFDAFGMGALLAWCLTYQPQFIPNYYNGIRLVGIISLLTVIMYIGVYHVYVPFRFLCASITIWVISYILLHSQKQSFANNVLNNKILIYLGKISYGLYLYHIIIFIFISKILSNLEKRGYVNLSDTYSTVLLWLISTVLLLLASWFSWHYIEKPFLNFKKFYVLYTEREIKIV